MMLTRPGSLVALVCALAAWPGATVPPSAVLNTAPLATGGPLVFALSDVTLPAAPRLIHAHDADGDGDLEITVLGSSFGQLLGQISTLENDGNGTFTLGWTSPHPADVDALSPMWLDLADVDLDGDLDASITPSGNDHTVRLNDGDGELDMFRTGHWFGGYAGPGAFGDVTGDGLPDLAHFTDDFGGSYIDIGEGLGDGAFPGWSFWTDNPRDGRTLIRFADVTETGVLTPILSTQSGIYQPPPSGFTWDNIVSGAFRGHEVIDLDGDTHLDIVFAEPAADRLGVVLGNGDGTWSAASWFNTGREPDQIVVADMDGDGVLDVVTGNVDQGSISILLGDGAGGFGPKQDIPTGPGPLGLTAGDFDLDGDTDLAVADAGATTVTILLQQTGGAR